MTANLDLVVALDAENARSTIEALAELDYRPAIPLPGLSFADKALRRE